MTRSNTKVSCNEDWSLPLWQMMNGYNTVVVYLAAMKSVPKPSLKRNFVSRVSFQFLVCYIENTLRGRL